jgi:hypothetical protein
MYRSVLDDWKYSAAAESSVLPTRYDLNELQPEGGVEAAALGFEIIKSVITPMTQGDINVTWPNSPIGVVMSPKPPGLRLNSLLRNNLIINFRTESPVGIEGINVRLRCHVQYNGPDVQATFSFDAEGRRSRFGIDTYITVNNPLSLETRPAGADWQRVGVNEYPVVYIPVEFRVDRWWPQSNHNETFMLVISGMYGFGPSADDRQFIKDRRVVYT